MSQEDFFCTVWYLHHRLKLCFFVFFEKANPPKRRLEDIQRRLVQQFGKNDYNKIINIIIKL